jgi:dipeptidyl aminopeptidase/acylaminoacyl peptidase
VRDPQRSPDGKWVAYTVATPDSARDRSDTDLWMTTWDGSQTLRLTWTPEPESSPRWSPDNRWLAFVSGRQEGKGGQVWLLDRRGGEAQRVTQIKGGVSDLVWAPDAKRFAVVVDEETDSLVRRDTTEKKTPPPIVIDRYAFKRDIAGYLGTKRTRVAVFDLDTRKLDTLAHGATNDDSPSWSPDGQRIAFQRATLAEPGHAAATALYVAPARGGEAVRVSGDLAVTGDRAAWSPDGQTLAFLRGDEPKYSAYVQPALVVVAADGRTAPRAVAPRLDRPVSSPTFEPGGASLLVTITDDRRRYLARVHLADGSVTPVLDGRRVVGDYSAPEAAADRGVALLLATPERPGEVYALDPGAEPRQLSHQNDSLFAALAVAPTEDVVSRSADGTEVHSLLLRPPGQPNGTRLPLLLYIHGGPNGQDQYEFNLTRQFLAARGYAVLAVNYRGSNGRGAAYQKAIYADWGNKEVVDILGAVDRVVAMGVADSARMGIGGWSYGGILTDYTVATTRRFKAAISGAGSALQLSMYGADQYVTQYEHELGAPWQRQDLWVKLSYPFFHADRISTPTLFMVGERDFNVPAIGSEQMYQALRTLGVPTQLVIYPNQFHGLTVPSYLVDRMRRWVAWYDRWLQPRPAAAAAAATP